MFQGDVALDYQSKGKSTQKCYIIELLTNLAFIENIVIMMASKDVWETVLDHIQYIKYSNNVNEIKILEKISKYVDYISQKKHFLFKFKFLIEM